MVEIIITRTTISTCNPIIDTLISPFIFDTSEDWLSVEIQPETFSINSAYPNPFNGSVSFAVNSTKSGPVLVSIFSIHGKLVNQFKSSVNENSSKVIRWIPESTVSTGTYFVSVNSNQFTQSQKILFIK